MRTKKAISIFLLICMLMSMLPLGVGSFAANGDGAYLSDNLVTVNNNGTVYVRLNFTDTSTGGQLENCRFIDIIFNDANGNKIAQYQTPMTGTTDITNLCVKSGNGVDTFQLGFTIKEDGSIYETAFKDYVTPIIPLTGDIDTYGMTASVSYVNGESNFGTTLTIAHQNDTYANYTFYYGESVTYVAENVRIGAKIAVPAEVINGMAPNYEYLHVHSEPVIGECDGPTNIIVPDANGMIDTSELRSFDGSGNTIVGTDLYACYVKKMVTINYYDYSGNKMSVSHDKYVGEGYSVLNYVNPNVQGYDLSHWVDKDGNTYTPGGFISITKALDLYAVPVGDSSAITEVYFAPHDSIDGAKKVSFSTTGLYQKNITKMVVDIKDANGNLLGTFTHDTINTTNALNLQNGFALTIMDATGKVPETSSWSGSIDPTANLAGAVAYVTIYVDNIPIRNYSNPYVKNCSTVTLVNGLTGNSTELKYSNGSTITLDTITSLPEFVGVTANGWYVGEAKLSENEFPYTIENNVKFTYKWTNNVYTITYYVELDEHDKLSLLVGEDFTDFEPEVPYKKGYVGEWIYYNGTFTDNEGYLKAGDKMPAKNIEAYAAYTEAPVTVTYVSGIAGVDFSSLNLPKEGEKLLKDSVITLAVAPTAPAGDKFVAWMIDGVQYGAGATYTVKANTVVTAVWESQLRYVKYYADEAGTTLLNASEPETYFVIGEPIYAPAVPEKTGHSGKWLYAPEGTSGTYTEMTVMPPKNLKAVPDYTVNTYNVHYYIDGEYVHGDTVQYDVEFGTYSVPEKAGYTFSGWTWSTTAGNGEKPTNMPAYNLAAYGYYEPNTYNIDVYEKLGLDSNWNLVETIPYTYNTKTLSVTATAREGHSFDHWTINVDGTNVYDMVKNNDLEFTLSEVANTLNDGEKINLIAVYSANSYTIHFKYGVAEVNGNITWDNNEEVKNVAYGTPLNTVMLPIFPALNADQNATGWMWGDINVETDTMPAHDIYVYNIAYTKTDIVYTVNFFFQDNHGIYSNTPAKVITVNGYVNSADFAGIEFLGFRYDTEENGKETTLTPDDHVINVYFKRLQYNLIFVGRDGTTVVDTVPHYYREGIKMTTKAAPEITGYTFAGWAIPSDLEVMPAHNLTIKATYTKNTYTVRYYAPAAIANPESTASWINVNTVTTVLDGRISTVAPAYEGYTFKGWYYTLYNGTEHVKYELGEGDNTLTEQMITGYGAEVGLYAEYTRNNYTVNVYYYDQKGAYTVDSETYKEIPYGDKIEINTEKYDNYYQHELEGWYGMPDENIMPAHDINIFANYKDVEGHYDIQYWAYLYEKEGDAEPTYKIMVDASYYIQSQGIAVDKMAPIPKITGYTTTDTTWYWEGDKEQDKPAGLLGNGVTATAKGYIEVYARYYLNRHTITYVIDETPVFEQGAYYGMQLQKGQIFGDTRDDHVKRLEEQYPDIYEKLDSKGYTLSAYNWEYSADGIKWTPVNPDGTAPNVILDYDYRATATYEPNDYVIEFIVDDAVYDTIEYKYNEGSLEDKFEEIEEPFKYGHYFTGWVWDGTKDTTPKKDANNEVLSSTYISGPSGTTHRVVADFAPNSQTVTYNLYYYDYNVDGTVGDIKFIGSNPDTITVYFGDTYSVDQDMLNTILDTKDEYTYLKNNTNVEFLGWVPSDDTVLVEDQDIVLTGIITNKNILTYTVEIYEEAYDTENEDAIFNGEKKYVKVESATLPAVYSQRVSLKAVEGYNANYLVDALGNKTIEVVGRNGFEWAATTYVDGNNDYIVVDGGEDNVIRVFYNRKEYNLTYKYEFISTLDEGKVKTEDVFTTYKKYGEYITSRPADDKTSLGYKFIGWKQEPQYMPAYNVTVVGLYEAIVYDITYDFGVIGTDKVTPPSPKNPTKFDVMSGIQTIENAPSYNGLEFAGWLEVELVNEDNIIVSGNNSVYNFDSKDYTYKEDYAKLVEQAKSTQTFNPTDAKNIEDKHFIAIWKFKNYTITFDANDGSGRLETLTAEYNKYVSLDLGEKTFERRYYTLIGWSKNPHADKPEYFTGTMAINVADPAKNETSVTLYAVWSANDTKTIMSVVPVVGENYQPVELKPNISFGQDIYQQPTTPVYNPVVTPNYEAPTANNTSSSKDDTASSNTPAKETNKVNLKDTSAAGSWKNPFTDVSENASYYNAVRYVYMNGLFKGMSATEFGSETTMTRAMYVTVLGRLLNIDASLTAKSNFKDVENGEWYTAYVNWAAENGIVLGDGAGNFMPDKEITREEMMVILYRFAQFCGFDSSNLANVKLSYRDTKNISDWAIDAVKYCKKNNLTDVTVIGNIYPTREAKRYEVAEIIYKFMEFVAE